MHIDAFFQVSSPIYLTLEDVTDFNRQVVTWTIGCGETATRHQESSLAAARTSVRRCLQGRPKELHSVDTNANDHIKAWQVRECHLIGNHMFFYNIGVIGLGVCRFVFLCGFFLSSFFSLIGVVVWYVL